MSKCQITSLIKVSILKTTHSASERPTEGVHVGIADIEGEVTSIRAVNRTTPIEAAGTDIDERTIAAEAGARQGQLKR